MSTHVRLWVVC